MIPKFISNYLKTTLDGELWLFPYLENIGENGSNLSLLEGLLERSYISVLHKIDALELAGTILLLQTDDADSVTQAFQYWNTAINLRDGQAGSIPSKVLLNDNSVAHWRSVEWTTKDQLRELQHCPSDHKIQGIMTLQRILSNLSSSALIKFDPVLLVYCQKLGDNHQFTKLIEVCWVTLEASRHQQVLERDHLWMSGGFIDQLIRTLYALKEERNLILTSEILRMSLELLSWMYLNMDIAVPSTRHIITRSTYHLVSILAQLPQLITHEMMCCLHQLVRRRDRRNSKNDFYGLLLTTCHMAPIAIAPISINLLLKAGADPNATDGFGYNALHILTGRLIHTEEEEEALDAIMAQLIRCGAHLDHENSCKKTPTDHWKMNKRKDLPPSLNIVPSLACLSARALPGNGTSYDDLQRNLPKTLYDLVVKHHK